MVGKHVLGGHTCEGVLALGADGEECWVLHELEIKHLIKSPVFYNKQSVNTKKIQAFRRLVCVLFKEEKEE